MADLRIVTISADELDARIEAAVEAAVQRVVAKMREASDEWIDADAAAKLLGVHPRTVTRLARKGQLPHAKVGGLLRFSRAAIDERLRRAG